MHVVGEEFVGDVVALLVGEVTVEALQVLGTSERIRSCSSALASLSPKEADLGLGSLPKGRVSISSLLSSSNIWKVESLYVVLRCGTPCRASGEQLPLPSFLFCFTAFLYHSYF